MKATSLEGTVTQKKLKNDTDFETNLLVKRRRCLSLLPSPTETASQSPLVRLDTFYSDSTIKNASIEDFAQIENLEKFTEDLDSYSEFTRTINGASRSGISILQHIDRITSVLDVLGNLYPSWKHGQNGLLRFYCHKFNVSRILATCAYYDKILSGLELMDCSNVNLKVLSLEYEGSDSKENVKNIYSRSNKVERVLCQLDELGSCYCSQKCAFGIYKNGVHVCNNSRGNTTDWDIGAMKDCFISSLRFMSNCEYEVMDFFSERGIMHCFSRPYVPGHSVEASPPFPRAVICANCGNLCRCRCQRRLFRSFDSDISESRVSSEISSKNFLNSLEDHSSNNNFRVMQASVAISHELKTQFGTVHVFSNPHSECSPVTKSMLSGKRKFHTFSAVVSQLFKISLSKTTSEEIFNVLSTEATAHSLNIEEEALLGWRNVPNFKSWRYCWWRLSSGFVPPSETPGDINLGSTNAVIYKYVLSVLETLDALGNIRYDPRLKLIGVGYLQRRNRTSCYWRYFYVSELGLWQSFTKAVEYFLLISTLPIELSLDIKSMHWTVCKCHQGVMHRKSFSTVKYGMIRGYYLALKWLESILNGFNIATDAITDFENEPDVGKDTLAEEKCIEQGKTLERSTVADALKLSTRRKEIAYLYSISGNGISQDLGVNAGGWEASTPNSSTLRVGCENESTVTSKSKHINLPRAIERSNILYPQRSVISLKNFDRGIFGKELSKNFEDTSDLTPSDLENDRNPDTTKDAKFNPPLKTQRTLCNKWRKLDKIRLRGFLSVLANQYPELREFYNTAVRQLDEGIKQLKVQAETISIPNRGNSESKVHTLIQSVSDVYKHPNSTTVSGSLDVFYTPMVTPGDSKKISSNPTGDLVDFPVQDTMETLPINNVTYHKNSDAWTCALECAPCVTCVSKACEKTTNCMFFPNGRELIQNLSKKLKPCTVKFTAHPFYKESPGMCVIKGHTDSWCLLSYSVAKYGYEGAKALAIEFRRRYVQESLAAFLSDKNDIYDKMLLVSISNQLVSMFSTQAYIANFSHTFGAGMSKIEDGSNVTHEPTFSAVDLKVKLEDDLKKQNSRLESQTFMDIKFGSLDNKLLAKDLCFSFGTNFVSVDGKVCADTILKTTLPLSRICRIFGITYISRKLLSSYSLKGVEFCINHCCWVTHWTDFVNQNRVMYHKLEAFLDIKTVSTLISKFDYDWTEAITLHGKCSFNYSEGSKKIPDASKRFQQAFETLIPLQRILYDALIASFSLALRALTDSYHERGLLKRLFEIYTHLKSSDKDTAKEVASRCLAFSDAIVLPFGSLHDEATPPLSTEE